MKILSELIPAVTYIAAPMTNTFSANTPLEAELGMIVLIPMAAALIVMILLGSVAIGLGKTLLSEWCVAWLFRFDKDERRVVLLTNLVSQGAIWAAMILILLVGGIPSARFSIAYYVGWMIVLEGLLCTFEFLWYCKKFIWYSQGRCLAFTLVANAASLLLGLLSTLEILSLAGHP